MGRSHYTLALLTVFLGMSTKGKSNTELPIIPIQNLKMLQDALLFATLILNFLFVFSKEVHGIPIVGPLAHYNPASTSTTLTLPQAAAQSTTAATISSSSESNAFQTQ